jgi:hypothetical protein
LRTARSALSTSSIATNPNPARAAGERPASDPPGAAAPLCGYKTKPQGSRPPPGGEGRTRPSRPPCRGTPAARQRLRWTRPAATPTTRRARLLPPRPRTPPPTFRLPARVPHDAHLPDAAVAIKLVLHIPLVHHEGDAGDEELRAAGWGRAPEPGEKGGGAVVRRECAAGSGA